MASYHIQGKVMIWYQDAMEIGIFNNWVSFCRGLQVQFGPIANDDYMEVLTRLKQTSTVASYKVQLEALFNRLWDPSEQHKLSYFLIGLRDKIWLPIWMLNSIILNAASGLATIQEEYLTSTKSHKGQRRFT